MIKNIKYSDTIPFHKQGRKHKLIFHEYTNYIGYFRDEKIIAIAGYQILKDKAILRSTFISPEFRKQGIYRALTNWRLAFLENKDIKNIELTCTSMSIKYHLKNGAKIIKQFKNFTKVKYTL